MEGAVRRKELKGSEKRQNKLKMKREKKKKEKLLDKRGQ